MNDEELEYKEFSKRMNEQFPQMFSGRYGGFAVGKGWWPMLEALCNTIQNHINYNKNCPQVVVEQIKEKFGTLRFYYQGGDEFIHGAVYLAESMSGLICEDCGAPGERRSGGWVRTLCDKHEEDRQALLEARHAKENGLEL